MSYDLICRIWFISQCFITVLWCGNSQGFQLSFVTWPNETEVVVNETVKFLWKYYVKDTDVDIKWGTSTNVGTAVASFKEIFFVAKNYEKNRVAKMSKKIPVRYRDRVRIVGQASLQIVNVSLEDEGDYLCEIREKGGWKTLSRAATLHVLSKYNRIRTCAYVKKHPHHEHAVITNTLAMHRRQYTQILVCCVIFVKHRFFAHILKLLI